MVVLLLHVGALGMVRVLLSRRCLTLLSLWHRYLCWRVVGGVVMAVLVLLSISHGGVVVVVVVVVVSVLLVRRWAAVLLAWLVFVSLVL
jgi:hypothetical protein